mmetsp:Transcript_4838/g.16866  ORF Transcript_4838/g.16866 Transcript_4838/m.16866 type:complete len:307 (+) Transcript_4838:3450-4370(+)
MHSRAATSSCQKPRSHGVHVPATSGFTVPGGQSTHSVLFKVGMVPGLQGKHASSRAAPTRVFAYPAGHCTHVCDAASAYVPMGHGVQMANAPSSGCTQPRSHSLHSHAPPRTNFRTPQPKGHTERASMFGRPARSSSGSASSSTAPVRKFPVRLRCSRPWNATRLGSWPVSWFAASSSVSSSGTGRVARAATSPVSWFDVSSRYRMALRCASEAAGGSVPLSALEERPRSWSLGVSQMHAGKVPVRALPVRFSSTSSGERHMLSGSVPLRALPPRSTLCSLDSLPNQAAGRVPTMPRPAASRRWSQ